MDFASNIPTNISRRQFIKMCGVLGLVLPLAGCTGRASLDGNFSGRVLIIGAGAAGMSAGYLLNQKGVDFQILEAAPTHGGRIKRTNDFVDFPIPLGGEWLHVSSDELNTIVNDDSVDVSTQMASYENDDEVGYFDGELSIEEAGKVEDLKFVGSSWLDFFDEYIVPDVAERMTFDTEVVEVNYSGARIVLTDSNGNTFEGDRVIVTVPLRVLQDERILFTPPLPDKKLQTIEKAFAWGGMKVFLEFGEKFYPTALNFPDSDTERGQRLYYDAAYGQNSTANVLGLFSVGTAAEPCQALDDAGLRDHILAELDEVFDGAATRTYIKHISQNWSEEPFINQAYLFDNSDPSIPKALWEPVADKVLFSGEAYTRHLDWGGVHDAARSASDSVARILE